MTTNELMSPTDELLTPESCVEMSRSVYARAFGPELVLLDFGRGEYFGLDEVGATVWRGLESGQTLGHVADLVVLQYEVTRDTALRDLMALVSHQRAEGLLSIARGPAGTSRPA